VAIRASLPRARPAGARLAGSAARQGRGLLGRRGIGLGVELAGARSSRALRPLGLGLELARTGTGAHRGTKIGARFLEMRYSGCIGHRS